MAAPEFITGGGYYYGATAANEDDGHFNQKLLNNHFAVDELFDFSKEDEVFLDNSSTITAVDSYNSPGSAGDPLFGGVCFSADAQFSEELCIPIDDLAELEWLSNFVEDSSFSTVDGLHNLHQQQQQSITVTKPNDLPYSSSSSSVVGNRSNQPEFLSDVSVPGKARSKRPRAAPCDWTSRLLVLSPSSVNKIPRSTTAPIETARRKCLHCASEKTPQWRTGPMGPKTLCNACGVRYKSGRLVAEYRPSASPTFVPTEHSNSHRKVLELRRQNEIHRQQQRRRWEIVSERSIMSVQNDEEEDYLIHRHHYTPMI